MNDMQVCFFGCCIPLDVLIPALLAALYYYLGIDVMAYLPQSWRGKKTVANGDYTDGDGTATTASAKTGSCCSSSRSSKPASLPASKPRARRVA